MAVPGPPDADPEVGPQAAQTQTRPRLLLSDRDS